MPTKIEKDEITGKATTGHEWDGVKELDTPLPKWWLYVFYATIVWSIGYYVLYPAWPSFSSYTTGALNYSARSDIARDLREQAQQRAPFVDRIRAASLEQIRSDPQLLGFTMAGGRSVFAENCAACHGSGGSGAKGFPNLADDDWLWGGDLEAIHTTIRTGIRSSHPDSRLSQMPRFGLDGMLTTAQINDVAEYVLSLSTIDTDKAATQRGTAIFSENCAVCHGDKGQGNLEVGAPNLSDKIWLYGGDKRSVTQIIANSRNGVMPAWADRLDEATIKMLAVYVHSLGGGR
ncbi:MAG: cytochrome-c oxidase, cbb3-type subunit III [Alphaproteobacteria bacterium]|nr:cytochrome-c oxidase, cbb3-type subunit III [Alphaproteobacteria bacterium]